MALSNWLTRGEWNASFLAYYVYAAQQAETTGQVLHANLSTQLRTGICMLDHHGYKNWTGIGVSDNTDLNSIAKSDNTKYGVNACTAEGDNSGVLADMISGTLDVPTRADETLLWMKQHPELVFPELLNLCEAIATSTTRILL